MIYYKESIASRDLYSTHITMTRSIATQGNVCISFVAEFPMTLVYSSNDHLGYSNRDRTRAYLWHQSFVKFSRYKHMIGVWRVGMVSSHAILSLVRK